MPVYRLTERIAFPPPEHADEHGLLAVGGDLSAPRLLLAYSTGIFPWPVDGYPLLWFSPDPRTVLPTDELRVPRRLARKLRQGRFRVTADRAFRRVVEGCARAPRPGGHGTWITPEIADAYLRLHDLGLAHSVEAWADAAGEADAEDGEELVGGLYGVSLGGLFVGESMFYRVSDASKVALVTLVRQLDRWGMPLFDAQVSSALVHRLGGRDWPRERYLSQLRRLLELPTRRGEWRLDGDSELGTAER